MSFIHFIWLNIICKCLMRDVFSVEQSPDTLFNFGQTSCHQLFTEIFAISILLAVCKQFLGISRKTPGWKNLCNR